MDIFINTDNQIPATQELKNYYKAELENALKRFDEHVTRYEVYFSDANSSGKDTPGDKQCVIEARLKGKKPEHVSHNATELKAAFDGAVNKMKNLLTRHVEKQRPF